MGGQKKTCLSRNYSKNSDVLRCINVAISAQFAGLLE